MSENGLWKQMMSLHLKFHYSEASLFYCIAFKPRGKRKIGFASSQQADPCVSAKTRAFKSVWNDITFFNNRIALFEHTLPMNSHFSHLVSISVLPGANRRLTLAFIEIMENSVRCASRQWLFDRKVEEMTAAAAGSHSVFTCPHAHDKETVKRWGIYH